MPEAQVTEEKKVPPFIPRDGHTIIYRWTPPPREEPDDFNDQTPGEYVVTRWGDRRAQIMTWGTYRGTWHANAAERGLVEHLLSIVAKLPKTADGVPIVHPMRLFSREGYVIDGVSYGPNERYFVGAKVFAADEVYASWPPVAPPTSTQADAGEGKPPAAQDERANP